MKFQFLVGANLLLLLSIPAMASMSFEQGFSDGIKAPECADLSLHRDDGTDIYYQWYDNAVYRRLGTFKANIRSWDSLSQLDVSAQHGIIYSADYLTLNFQKLSVSHIESY